MILGDTPTVRLVNGVQRLYPTMGENTTNPQSSVLDALIPPPPKKKHIGYPRILSPGSIRSGVAKAGLRLRAALNLQKLLPQLPPETLEVGDQRTWALCRKETSLGFSMGFHKKWSPEKWFVVFLGKERHPSRPRCHGIFDWWNHPRVALTNDGQYPQMITAGTMSWGWFPKGPNSFQSLG